MKRQRKGGLQSGPLLAIIGGALGVASLLMPWFVFNRAGLEFAIQHVDGSDFARSQQAIGLPVDHLQGSMRAGLAQVMPVYADKLHGYQTYSQVSVIVQAVAAGLAILVGFLGLVGLLRRRGLILFAASIALIARPIYSLVIPPASSTLEPIGFEHAHLLSPTLGFWLSLAAGLVVFASTFGITARAALAVDAPVGKYGEGGPHVGIPQAGTASAPKAYAPAATGGAYAPSASSAYVPGVGGAMQSSATYGAPQSPYGSQQPAYGAQPAYGVPQQQTSAAPTVPGGTPGSGAQRRSVAPPPF